MVKQYDLVVFGTGSAMNVVSAVIQGSGRTVAVIEKDVVGGICLTRGCIPSKMLLYPAELLANIKRAPLLGINAEVRDINSEAILERMRRMVAEESQRIEEGLKAHPRIYFYKGVGEFIGDYVIRIRNELVRGDKILLCTGSRPAIPNLRGLEETGFLTSDDFFMRVKELPRSIIIIGGGYVAVELGFFMSMMGTRVTIVGRNSRIVPDEEPEVSELLRRELSRYMNILVNHKAVETLKRGDKKVVMSENWETGDTTELEADEILIATGRASNSDITKPERTGVKVDDEGWIITNEYLETTKPNIWAFGDANGKFMFKHKANYESRIVLYNAFLGKKIKASYHAIPHAIFTYPEVAAVGLRERDAAGKHDILVGYSQYEGTGKGDAMMVKDYFVKVIVERDTKKILGAHIIGPHASMLIQEIVNLMYTQDQSITPIYDGMHIHPALSEVVEKAFYNLAEPEYWRRP
jgi:dihydrolipoamide dehydrogenase